MQANRTVALVVAAALVGALAWWGWSAARESAEVGAPPPSAPIAEPAHEPAPAPELVREEAPPAESARASVAPEAPPAPEPQPQVAPEPAEELVAEVDARFVDAVGNPWSGVRFAVRGSRWAPRWEPSDAAQSEANGRVALRVHLPVNKNPMGVARREYSVEFEASRDGLATLGRSATLRAGETKHFGNIVMVPGGRILGRVEDGDGKSVVGAMVGVAPAQLTGDLERAGRHGGEFLEPAPRTKSGASGDFVLDGAPAGKLRAWAHADGFRYTWSEPLEVPPQGDAQGVVLVLRRLLATDRIAGRVLDPDGAPLLGANLWAEEHSRGVGTGGTVPVDETGHFELFVVHDDSTYDLRGSDALERFGSTLIRGVQPGTLDVELRLQRLEQFPVRVRDPEGRPVPGARFFVSTNSRMEYPSTSAVPGEYSIAKPTEPFTFLCVAKGFRTTRIGHPRTPIAPATLPEPPGFFEVVLQPARLLRGRVTAEGSPVAGARVYDARDQPSATGTTAGYRHRYWVGVFIPDGLRTDADGRFELDCDHEQGFWLRIVAEGWAPWEVGPLEASSLEPVTEFEVELTHGGAIEGRVLLPDGKDASGTIVGFNHGDSCPFTLRAGPGGTFRATGLAPGKWQVLPAKAEIGVDGITYSGIDTDEPMVWSCEVRDGETTRFDLDLTKP